MAYTSSKFVQLKGNCPICLGEHKSCKQNDELIHCRSHSEPPQGYDFVGEDKIGFAMYAPARDDSQPYDFEAYRANREARLAKQARQKEQALKAMPSLEDRDRLIRSKAQKLSNAQNDDLLRRGLTQDEINKALSNHWLFGLQGGYGIAAYDPTSRLLCGAQRANDDRTKKYTWGVFSDQNQLKETGENPLFVRLSPEFDDSKPCEIHYCEKALGSLVYGFMQWRTNPQIIVIGAAGGQFGKQSLNRALGALPKADKHILLPDAGSVINKGVYSNYKKLEEHLESFGIGLQVADWGQFAIKKADGGKDCDELGANFDYALIDSSAYFDDALKAKNPLSWLIKKANQVRNRLTQGFGKLPEIKADTYEHGDRADAWTKVLSKSKNILDASFTGGGKSHTVGKLRPEMFSEFGITRLIYATNDPRNVSTSTLKDWILVPSRHNGITDKQGQLRRANSKDDELVTPANCSRVDAINALRSKGITNDKTVCDTCPMLNACRNAVGDGYGFKYQRAIALKADRLICHPLALPHPDEFDYSSTFVIFEEPSESFNVQREVKVTVKDIDNLIIKLAEANLITEFMPVFKILKELLGDRSLRYGLDYHAIKSVMPESIPSKEKLEDILKPDLSILATKDSIDDSEFENVRGKDKRQLARISALLKRETTMHSNEVKELIQSNVLTQWLPEFLDIITVATSGDLNIQHGTLTITIADYQLRTITAKSAKNLFLDATLHPKDLEMKLGAPVTVVKQFGNMPMPKITKLTGLGRMGQQRGEEQTRRKDAIVSHIKTSNPNKIVKVIDFKGNESDGIWWRDSRGSNAFIDADTLIVIGTPCRNIAALKAEYSVLKDSHPDSEDQDFGTWVNWKILADIQQCFGRKSGNRFKDGDEIYFISDFDLGDIPHAQIKAGDITPDAMSQTEQTEKWICDRLTELKNQGFDLLSMAGREIQRLLGISHGQYERFKNSAKSWIGLLYSSLNSNPIQDLNEIESMAQISDPPPIDEPILKEENLPMAIAPTAPKTPSAPGPNSKPSNKTNTPPQNESMYDRIRRLNAPLIEFCEYGVATGYV
jgi:hypothetical protein